jgi:hypothetical protein
MTFSGDIYPLLSTKTVTPQAWGELVGCATSGCHDSTAAGGLAFNDPDASYQQLVNGRTVVENCSGNPTTQVLNASSICSCQSLVISGDGNHSLLFELLNNAFACPAPIGGIANPMPIDDAGVYHPLSACLANQLRQWIDQGAAY